MRPREGQCHCSHAGSPAPRSALQGQAQVQTVKPEGQPLAGLGELPHSLLEISSSFSSSGSYISAASLLGSCGHAHAGVSGVSSMQVLRQHSVLVTYRRVSEIRGRGDMAVPPTGPQPSGGSRLCTGARGRHCCAHRPPLCWGLLGTAKPENL